MKSASNAASSKNQCSGITVSSAGSVSGRPLLVHQHGNRISLYFPVVEHVFLQLPFPPPSPLLLPAAPAAKMVLFPYIKPFMLSNGWKTGNK
ncbi:MAG: hypothetical protein ACFFD4_12460 [Candidatus Odinarchaeota archaeon]